MAHFVFTKGGTSHCLYLQFFTEVKNCDALIENSGRFDCCFIDPVCIVSVTQVLQAANRALMDEKSKTGNLYLDIAYYLSPEEEVDKALGQVLANGKSNHLLIATFQIEVLETLKSAVDGLLGDITQLPKIMNLTKIKQIFKLNTLSQTLISDLVYSTLAIKNLEINNSSFYYLY